MIVRTPKAATRNAAKPPSAATDIFDHLFSSSHPRPCRPGSAVITDPQLAQVPGSALGDVYVFTNGVKPFDDRAPRELDKDNLVVVYCNDYL